MAAAHSFMTTIPTDLAALEAALAPVERGIAAMAGVLGADDADRIDVHARELHHALAGAVDRFAQAARDGSIPQTLRNRLACATGRVAAQRESLARATAALDRAIDVLLPAAERGSLYSANGSAERSPRGGGFSA